MPNTLPPEINVHTTATGVLYEMQPREVGWLRRVGVVLLLIGLGLIGAAVYIVLIRTGLWDWLMSQRRGDGLPFDPSMLFDAFFALPCLFFGLPLVKFGRFLMGGRSVIEVSGDKLISTQGSGLLRRRKKYPISKISKLQIKTFRPGETTLGLSDNLGALNIVLRGGKVKNLTWGYQQNSLRALAGELSSLCEQQAGAVLYEDEYQPIEVEERTIGDEFHDSEDSGDQPLDAPPCPDDAVAILDKSTDGITITVPPVGIHKGSKGMFGFSIFWNGFMVIFTIGWIAQGGSQSGDDWIAWIIIPLFWAVGIGMMLAAINAGRRQAILDVVGDTLLITRNNIFKTRQDEVPRNNIKSIMRAPSGMEVNDVPILNLQVHRREGKKIAMLSQLSNSELAWIAGELRHALRLSDLEAEDEAKNPSSVQLRPGKAVASVDRRRDGLTISVPAVGIFKGSKGLLGFSIVWNLFIGGFTTAVIFIANNGIGPLLLILAFLSIFWAVGIGSMLCAINAGRRRAILDVVGNTLLVTRKSIFKTSQQEVHRDNIKAIRRDTSGTKVNDVAILNLQVHKHEGKKIAMLSQLDDDELAWIASELRAALGVPGR